MMVHSLLNHIQGKNGSQWAQFVRETGTDYMLMVAIDAAKYTHKAMLWKARGTVPLALGTPTQLRFCT